MSIEDSNQMETKYVMRDTFYPSEDLERDWTPWDDGWDNELKGQAFESSKEAERADMEVNGGRKRVYRYHEELGGYVLFYCEGLCAFEIKSTDLNEAMEEAYNLNKVLIQEKGPGDGHFFAFEALGFLKVKEGRYLFEIEL